MSYISLPLREINLKRWCKVGFDQNMQDILCVCVCVCVCVCYMTYILCGGSRRKGGRTGFLEIKVLVLSNNDF